MAYSEQTNGANPVGVFKRFGTFGPVYKVVEVEKPDDTLLVSVVDSGESVHYPYAKFLLDPRV